MRCNKTMVTLLASLSSDVSGDRLSPLIDVDMLDPDVLVSAVTERRRVSTCAEYARKSRAAADASATTRRSLPPPPPNRRNHFRSAIASAVQSPVLKFPFFGPRGAPGLNPPCRRHRLRPRVAGRWHGVPPRVRAPQRGACLTF